MTRHVILIPLLLSLIALIFIYTACSPGLPKEEEQVWFNLGHFDGRSWGDSAAAGNWKVFWVSPDKVQDFQRNDYIPKGYLPVDDFATAHFTDGTPYNGKQKKQACEAYNWGFFYGFYRGAGLPSP